MRIDGSRPFVELTFRKPDGSDRLARFWLDTGGGAFVLAETLARDLGLELGAPFSEEGMELAETSRPITAVGDFLLDLVGAHVLTAIGVENLVPPVAPGHAEGLFPGHVLARHHVVFDYPAGQFTIAAPQTLEPAGTEVPVTIHPKSGCPRVELEVDGAAHGFLLDTGASYTMVSHSTLKDWGDTHPDWPRFAGPVDEAKTLGGSVPEETLVVPEIRWGPIPLLDVGMVERPEGTFERWMTSMMTGPVIGALAGNVLKDLRLDLDYSLQSLRVQVRA